LDGQNCDGVLEENDITGTGFGFELFWVDNSSLVEVAV